MWTQSSLNRNVIAREDNVVHIDFGREPDPPDPNFPGAGALRNDCQAGEPLDAVMKLNRVYRISAGRFVCAAT